MLYGTKPSSAQEAAAIARARHLTDFKWTPVRDVATYTRQEGNTVLPMGEELTGFPYSSLERTDNFITENVSIETFLTNIPNPDSKLYSAPEGALGAPSLGIVCNGLVRYAFGIKERVSTKRWLTIPGMRMVKAPGEYTFEDLRLLDVLYAFCEERKHVALVTDILRDENGVIREIEVSHAKRPLCVRMRFTWEEYARWHRIFGICRYDKLNDIPLLDENDDNLVWRSGLGKIRPKITVNLGNKSNYRVGECVIISVFSDTPDVVDIISDGKVIKSYPVAGRATVPIEPGRGYYTARLREAGDRVEFAVMQARTSYEISGDEITVRADPMDTSSRILYMDFREATPHATPNVASLSKYELLTDEEISSGVITRKIPEDAASFKVYYENEYGIWTHQMTLFR